MDVTGQAGTSRPELLAADDATIEDAIGFAEPMVLRGLLYQLTGDPEVAATGVKTVHAGYVDLVAPATDADVALLRRKATAFLKAYRDSGAGAIDIGPRARLADSLSLLLGRRMEGESLQHHLEELALDPKARALRWQATPDPARPLSSLRDSKRAGTVPNPGFWSRLSCAIGLPTPSSSSMNSAGPGRA